MVTTPEPGGTPGTPVTPGTARTKRIAALLAADPEAFDWITAEAARSERERLREAIHAITGQQACFCEFDNRPGEEGLFVDRAAVLALLRDPS